jgi:hypothetical protein
MFQIDTKEDLLLCQSIRFDPITPATGRWAA